ncbi:hypothetical protein [Phenylobacterium sp.]|uniref:hypothetical protein n=1 Tax=Phenylobacterium sp. TaxID=1871053 RepID=UPI002CBAB5E8|nr:hypothetical protein [Phenylobacterium sp.]HLZ76355.1 hypothetical protein [Phenylobacterium sp.]
MADELLVADPDKARRSPPATDAGRAPAKPAPRMVSAGLEASLEQFDDPQLLADGKVNLISLEAVYERLGDRWPFKRDQVYGFTDRVLERGVGDGGVYLRISDTDFFIVHPDLSRVAGQAACLRYLREVLNHFLGDDQMAAGSVLQVTRISGGELEARPADLRAKPGCDPEPTGDGPGLAETGQPDAPPSAAARPTPPMPAAADAGLERWTPFVCNDGRQLRVSATLEPVYELKGFTRIGFRMMRRVIVVATDEELSPQRIAQLSAADLLRVDVATILRGIGRLQHDAPGESPLSLIVPLSFVSLSSQRGRAELVHHLKTAGALVKMGVICEICDIEGVPPGMLLAAASLVRPFTLLTAGRLLAPTPAAVRHLAGASLQALSFDCPKGLGDAEFTGWAIGAIDAAKRMAKSVIVYGAGSPARAGSLASLGATHVSLAG